MVLEGKKVGIDHVREYLERSMSLVLIWAKTCDGEHPNRECLIEERDEIENERGEEETMSPYPIPSSENFAPFISLHLLCNDAECCWIDLSNELWGSVLENRELFFGH
eukprot:TRINITY_DN4334_c0_g1_i3.p2 TRINITY_DN4334_c0_g1~~TRINITY_DN4334_c0_g1_i3.p2  ORF type:complete len:108 (-),score=13.73 TRINITY_DN4334_c0_g1_i3:241-564(-)